MPDLTFAAIVAEQLRLLQHVCQTLTARALAGNRTNLEDLFAAQDRLEHWSQYLAIQGQDFGTQAFDAPAPLPGLRPAPPLPHEPEAAYDFADTPEAELRPQVSFPPAPFWIEDLERDPGEEREG